MDYDTLALFDLDHTLLPHDTDEQWVDFMVDAGRLDRSTFEQASHALAERYRRGEAGTIEFTEFYLSTLVPFNLDDLARWRQEFIRERIAPSISQAARDIVARHQGLGHLVVLTSATSEWLTSPIARAFGFEHLIATQAEVKAGRFTGRIVGTPNMREGKVERLLGWLAARNQKFADFRESWFYSDSQNDLPLLSHVTHPVVVNPDPVLAAHARHNGWAQMTIGGPR
jgi:HAD superfamily hydrolase (TIGR01490 family)